MFINVRAGGFGSHRGKKCRGSGPLCPPLRRLFAHLTSPFLARSAAAEDPGAPQGESPGVPPKKTAFCRAFKKSCFVHSELQARYRLSGFEFGVPIIAVDAVDADKTEKGQRTHREGRAGAALFLPSFQARRSRGLLPFGGGWGGQWGEEDDEWGSKTVARSWVGQDAEGGSRAGLMGAAGGSEERVREVCVEMSAASSSVAMASTREEHSWIGCASNCMLF